MDYKRALIILAIVIVIAGGSYFTWKYFFNKPKTPVIENIEKMDNNKNILVDDDDINKPNIKNTNNRNKNFEDINLKPYFDIKIGDNYEGRVIFELFDSDVPLTCKNFRYLCSNGLINKDKPSYQDNIFHRVIKDFMIQAGDITNGNGAGGFSIYGEKFNDENFNLTHNQPGILSMANAGPNTNNSQFFITTKKADFLDGKHVVFGIVSSGFDIIRKIENLKTDENDKPLEDVIIQDCGLINPDLDN
jgi:cyclophilin family peptidyl-prolyl cis-trans isomerase